MDIRKMWDESERAVAKLRAEFLQTSVEIEVLLTKTLATIISGSEGGTEEASSVRWFVLEHRDVTFKTKVEILRSYAKERSDPDLLSLAKKIDSVMERRNILAHGNWTTIAPDGGLPSRPQTPRESNMWSSTR